MIPYSSKDIQNFNNLLAIIMSNVDTTEENVKRLIPNEQEFKLVHIINSHYPSFKIENGFYLLTKEGIEIQRIGIKNHIIKIQNEQMIDIKIKELTLDELSKSELRNKRANKFSIIAIIISILLPIIILIGDKYFDSKIANNPKDSCNSKSATKINSPNFSSDKISKDSSNKINHNTDTLNK